jgi:hypothetical protein
MPNRVVHCKRAPFDVYIGRPGPWGNPFRIGADGDRQTVIEKYRAWLLARPELVERARRELAGKVLGCWCAPLTCHGDVLAAISQELLAPGEFGHPVAAHNADDVTLSNSSAEQDLASRNVHSENAAFSGDEGVAQALARGGDSERDHHTGNDDRERKDMLSHSVEGTSAIEGMP